MFNVVFVLSASNQAANKLYTNNRMSTALKDDGLTSGERSVSLMGHGNAEYKFKYYHCYLPFIYSCVPI